MSFSFKFFLNKRKKHLQKIYPLRLKLYRAGGAKEIGLGIILPEVDWDESTQSIKSTNGNFIELSSRIFDIRKKLLQLSQQEEANNKALMSLDDIANAIFPERNKTPEPPKPCFIQYATGIKDSLITSGKAGNALVYINTIRRLQAYIPGTTLAFDELTFKFLTDYNTFLLEEGLKVNGISIHFRTIRAIYNRAIKEGLIDYSNYPFKLFNIKSERTINRTLTVSELKAIIDLPLKVNDPGWHWRNVFLLSFYLIGTNLADLLTLKLNNIVDGRVIFRRKKTGKVYSVKLQEQANDILLYYTAGLPAGTDDYILPMIPKGLCPMTLRKAILQQVHTCNNYLKAFAKECHTVNGYSL